MSAASPRAVCERCLRPCAVCYCASLVELRTNTRVVILQHPRERHVPVNTARIASLCLPDAELHVGVDWTRSDVVQRALSDPARPAALLYPGEGAIDVERHPPAGPVTLVVVDGTWWQARKVVRTNAALAALPRYAFRPPAPSEYRIRAEPHEDCLSTLEAMAHVLGILEGDRARFATMLTPFREMVARQVAYAATGGGRPRMRNKRPRAPDAPRSALHALLRDRFDDLVCVVGEANAWPYDSPERAAGGHELVQWRACRVATGETFERFVRPQVALAPGTRRHLRVDAAAIESGVSRVALARDWAAFARPSDVIVSWGTHSLELFARAGGTLASARVDLRNVARLDAGAKVGTLESYAARAASEAAAMAAPEGSRAAERIAAMVALATRFARGVTVVTLSVTLLALVACSRATATSNAPAPLASVPSPAASTSAPSPAAVTSASAPAAPIASIYMGRRIAAPMGVGGADWLERGDREATERPEHVLDVVGLRPTDVVADVGAGSGYFSERIARRVPQGRVLATDLQPEMLALIDKKSRARHLGNVETRRVTELDAGLPPSAVDVVLMVDVYHELARPDLTLAQVHAALERTDGGAPGRLVLVEYRGEDPRVPIKPEHKTTLAQLRRELEASRFAVSRVDETLPQQRIVIAEPH